MDKSSLPLLRMILLILVVILAVMTAYLYFKTGALNLSAVTGTLGCLFMYLITGRKPQRP